MNGKLFAFCICFVIVALLAKIIGCGLISKLCKYTIADSLKIGVGMMTRGCYAEISLCDIGQGKTESYADNGHTPRVRIAVIQREKYLVEKKSAVHGLLRHGTLGQ